MSATEVKLFGRLSFEMSQSLVCGFEHNRLCLCLDNEENAFVTTSQGGQTKWHGFVCVCVCV